MQTPKKPVSNEKLSQLMDGEWYELNPSECVKGVCADEQLRGKWSRYHLIRDVMKNEPVQVDEQLVSRICAAIDDEPAYSNVTVFAGTAEAALDNESDAAYAPDIATSPLSEAVYETGTHAANATFDATLDATAIVTAIDAEANARSQAGEAEVNKETQKRSGLFGTGVAGFALAASVALVTVVGMNLWQSQGSLSGAPDSIAALDADEETVLVADAVADVDTVVDTVVDTDSVLPVVADGAINVADADNAFSQQVQGVPLPVVEFVANSGSYWVSPDTAERVDHEMRLNMFLSQHLENSPTSSREGLLPYSRLVGYDERSLER